jgi:hypothetical protein
MDMVTITRQQYERDIREAKAQALREASEEMRVGWGDLLRPDGSVFYGAQHHPDDGSRKVPLYEWLRTRADEIEATR